MPLKVPLIRSKKTKSKGVGRRGIEGPPKRSLDGLFSAPTAGSFLRLQASEAGLGFLVVPAMVLVMLGWMQHQIAHGQKIIPFSRNFPDSIKESPSLELFHSSQSLQTSDLILELIADKSM